MSRTPSWIGWSCSRFKVIDGGRAIGRLVEAKHDSEVDKMIGSVGNIKEGMIKCRQYVGMFTALKRSIA